MLTDAEKVKEVKKYYEQAPNDATHTFLRLAPAILARWFVRSGLPAQVVGPLLENTLRDMWSSKPNDPLLWLCDRCAIRSNG